MRFAPALVVAFAIVVATVPPRVAGQNLSIGLMAGGSITDGFQTENSPAVGRFFSTSKDYLIGPTLNWSVSPRWSIEADGLFRELHLAFAGTGPNGNLAAPNPEHVVTWEFPVLAKFRFSSSQSTFSPVRPFLEGGASFRTSGNLNGTNPSHYGFTTGVGIEMRVKRLSLAPVVRYTRWVHDEGISQPRSSANQLELAVGLYATPEADRQPLGMYVSVGALVGYPLTKGIRASGFSFVNGAELFSQITSPRRGVIGGPMVEIALPAHFSVEADAIYDPVRFITVTALSGTKSTAEAISLGNWEIPVLAKRRFLAGLLSPFLEGGPAFRTGAGDLSHFGVTGGIGFESHFGAIRIAPTLRYSRWKADDFFESSGSIRNQVEILVAVYLKPRS